MTGCSGALGGSRRGWRSRWARSFARLDSAWRREERLDGRLQDSFLVGSQCGEAGFLVGVFTLFLCVLSFLNFGFGHQAANLHPSTINATSSWLHVVAWCGPVKCEGSFADSSHRTIAGDLPH